MLSTRRDILKASSFAASSLILPRGIRAQSVGGLYEKSNTDHSLIAEKIRAVALNRAKEIGCDYADIRLLYRRSLKIMTANGFDHIETLGLAMRTLVNGYWGFCCAPIWSEESVLKAIDLAYGQAKGNSQGPAREIDISLYRETGESGEWIMPVKIDPFERNPYEFRDYIDGVLAFIRNFPIDTSRYQVGMDFVVNNVWFGATNGSMQFQRTYASSGKLGFMIMNGSRPEYTLETLPLSGMGYELFTDQDIYSTLREGFDELIELSELPVQPVEVGRYYTLIPGAGAANLLGRTLGAAVELDRIVGAEANAGGTSYIQNPAEELGSFKFGPSFLNVDYEREHSAGIGTRYWDDEGVRCSKGALVESGLVKKAFSDREMRAYISSSDQIATGNFIASDHSTAPSVRFANLVVRPNLSGSGSVKDMIKNIDRGVFFRSSNVGLDFQMKNGMITGDAYEVRNGRLTSRILGAGCWFNSTELWNNLELIGSDISQQRTAISAYKGEPASIASSSVISPAVLFKDAAIVDTTRK